MKGNKNKIDSTLTKHKTYFTGCQPLCLKYKKRHMASRRKKSDKKEKLKQTTQSIATGSGSPAIPGKKFSAEWITIKREVGE